MERIPMTAGGYKALEDEVNHLKTVERPSIIRMIAEARAHGDLSENAEYHAAKERQAFVEGRIVELEDKVSRADVIDISKRSGAYSVAQAKSRTHREGSRGCPRESIFSRSRSDGCSVSVFVSGT